MPPDTAERRPRGKEGGAQEDGAGGNVNNAILTGASVIRPGCASMGIRASADLDALTWLAEAASRARDALPIAVDGCRARGYSDAAIGAALGITRQAVWKRFPRQPKVDAGTPGTAVPA